MTLYCLIFKILYLKPGLSDSFFSPASYVSGEGARTRFPYQIASTDLGLKNVTASRPFVCHSVQCGLCWLSVSRKETWCNDRDFSFKEWRRGVRRHSGRRSWITLNVRFLMFNVPRIQEAVFFIFYLSRQSWSRHHVNFQSSFKSHGLFLSLTMTTTVGFSSLPEPLSPSIGSWSGAKNQKHITSCSAHLISRKPGSNLTSV